MVKWKAKTFNGNMYAGFTDDGSWKEFGCLVKALNQGIEYISLELEGVGAAVIDPGRDGYFISNRVIASLNSADQISLVGIGYWNRSQSTIRIKWYNAENMQLLRTEARPDENSEPSLIKNPKRNDV